MNQFGLARRAWPRTDGQIIATHEQGGTVHYLRAAAVQLELADFLVYGHRYKVAVESST